jgi:hypothetical protein
MDFEIFFEFLFEFFELKESSQGPRSPHVRRAWVPWALQNRSKIDQKIDQNFDVILVSFWVPLGSLLASLLDALGHPNRPKSLPNAS